MQTVLVIESEPANLLALALILRSFGYTVLEADSPEEALSICQEYLEPVDLVVTQAVPNDKSAIQLIARLQSLSPQVRALLISDVSADDFAETSIYGCAYLRKPFDVEALADSIGTLLDSPTGRAGAGTSTDPTVPVRKIWQNTVVPRQWQRWIPTSLVPDVAFEPSAPVRAVLKWSYLAIVLAVVVPLLLLSIRERSVPGSARVRSGHSLSLTLTGEGDRLHVTWDGAAPRIRLGRCGVLWIADGSIQRRITLDASEIRAGSLFYWPNTNDVSVRLDVSDTNASCGEPNLIVHSLSVVQPSEGSVRTQRQTETEDLPHGHPRSHMAPRRHRTRTSQPTTVSYSAHAVSSGLSPSLASPIESPEAPRLAPSGEPQSVENQILPGTASPVSESTPEPFSTVTIEANTESHTGGLRGKMPPLLRRLQRPASEFEPPTPVHESTPVVDDHLRRTIKFLVPLDVRVYINRSGKVDYAELLSDITEGNRALATLAVFDARHWEFTPARSGTRIVTAQAILHYRFGNPALATSRDQK